MINHHFLTLNCNLLTHLTDCVIQTTNEHLLNVPKLISRIMDEPTDETLSSLLADTGDDDSPRLINASIVLISLIFKAPKKRACTQLSGEVCFVSQVFGEVIHCLLLGVSVDASACGFRG
jgi:hypothetical protein